MADRVFIFDTTLRDGEQSPGVSFNIQEKLEIARQLVRLNVDIIEAGFPIASPGDFAAVQAIAREVRGPVIAGLCRANPVDIDRAWEALQEAEHPRIHIVIATSDLHITHKLQKTRPEVLDLAVAAVKQARGYTDNVEFSAEDASRSDLDYLCEVLEATIEAGATTVNIPDTVGYSVPQEFGEFIAQIRSRTKGIDQVVVSVHCHNDLGLAVANSLAAVANGAQQVECAVNGLGERAGNASLEEIVMGLYTRQSYFNKVTGIKYDEIYRTSKLVSLLSGMAVQANKAVVGKNAFLHASGIHQDGVLKERSTYEIMNPQLIGLPQSNIVLGKLSGRHAFRERLAELGLHPGRRPPEPGLRALQGPDRPQEGDHRPRPGGPGQERDPVCAGVVPTGIPAHLQRHHDCPDGHSRSETERQRPGGGRLRRRPRGRGPQGDR